MRHYYNTTTLIKTSFSPQNRQDESDRCVAAAGVFPRIDQTNLGYSNRVIPIFAGEGESRLVPIRVFFPADTDDFGITIG